MKRSFTIINIIKINIAFSALLLVATASCSPDSKNPTDATNKHAQWVNSLSDTLTAVRQEVAELIPRLFKDNENLRLGIVAFGDYCDMKNAQEFGDAYQCIMPTDNENDIIKFVRESKDTNGGDGDEFYELVIKKIVEETPWREGSTRAVLLISDASPHTLGYSYKDYVVNNQIDWRKEAGKAAEMKIKFDTVTITQASWYKELSSITGVVSAPFSSGAKTARLIEAATMSRGSLKSRLKWDIMFAGSDDECKEFFASYKKERDDLE